MIHAFFLKLVKSNRQKIEKTLYFESKEISEKRDPVAFEPTFRSRKCSVWHFTNLPRGSLEGIHPPEARTILVIAAAAAAAECRIQMVLIPLDSTRMKTTHRCSSTRMRSMDRNRRHVEPKISDLTDSQWRSFVAISEEPEAAVEPSCRYGGQGCDILDGRGPLASISVAPDLFESLRPPYLAGDPASPPVPWDLLNWDRPPPLDRNFLAPFLQR